MTNEQVQTTLMAFPASHRVLVAGPGAAPYVIAGATSMPSMPATVILEIIGIDGRWPTRPVTRSDNIDADVALAFKALDAQLGALVAPGATRLSPRTARALALFAEAMALLEAEHG